MARMRRDSNDSYRGDSSQKTTRKLQPEARTTRTSPRKRNIKTPAEHDDPSDIKSLNRPKVQSSDATVSAKQAKQRRLAPLNSLRDMSDLSSRLFATTLLDEPEPRRRRSPAKSSVILSHQVALRTETGSNETEPQESLQADIEESVWCGSDASSDTSEDELPSPRKFINFPPRNALREVSQDHHDLDLTRNLEFLSLEILPVSEGTKREISDSSRPTSSSDKENENNAILRFTPPRLYSPPKARVNSRPTTPPPASPSKGRLLSPSKRAVARIPTPPFRPSLDAFWNAETVNDWNDQYSPRKEWSPRKLKATQDEASTSPTGSPKKLQSPSKRTKADVAAKKDWETRKHEVAQAFLTELDRKVTDNKVGELAASTGGVRFIWSKTLNTTAGRANWRRETTKSRQVDGSVAVTHKHHASIELAEKVIDDEERLLNVVAHEFCHLANFMVSGIKDQPHGRQFKEWGRKCTRAFGHRGVEVTTKHSYQIEYNYIWRCSNDECAVEFKRHSKSIDPKRQSCGACRSKLSQIKPVPRKDAAGADGAVTGYAAFVKKHYADVKASLPAGVTQKLVMEAVGRRYREEKAARSALQGQSQGDAAASSSPALSSSEPQGSSDAMRTSRADVDDVAGMLEVITIEDD